MAIPNWLTLSSTGGTGNMTITITATTNLALTQRLATLTISGVSYSKSATTQVRQSANTISRIYFDYLALQDDVPYTGGTATSANCYFVIYAETAVGDIDITSAATVSGSLVVSAATKTYVRHKVGSMTLTASWEGFSTSEAVDVYQEAAPAPVITAISITDLEWMEDDDIPASGGSANWRNCQFGVYAKWSDGTETYIKDSATITSNTITVSANTSTTRKYAGEITITATYSGKSDTKSVNCYQEAFIPILTVNKSSINFGATGGTATFDITSNIGWKITGK